MDEQQLAGIAKRLHRQEQQIERLVNLLLAVLDGKPNSDVEATDYIFVQTTLYEYIKKEEDWEGELATIAAKLIEAKAEAIRQKGIVNQLKRKIVEMELK